jgi:sugar lactone lactonase YvrE
MRPCLAILTLAPLAVAQAPDNTIWATNFSSSIRSISKIDPRGEILISAAVPAPFGLAMDTAGNVWAGSNGTTITKTDPTGTTTASYPVGSFPQSVALDMNGFVWVANRTSNSVMKVDSAGVVQTTVPLPAGTSPIGVIVDALNQVWVSGFHASTSTTHTLTVLDSAGTVLNTFSYPASTAGSGFSFPTADPNGNIWVANQARLALLQIDQTGAIVSNTNIASGLPRGCAVDGLGFCWLANQGFTGSCVKVDPAGVILATFLPTATTFTTVSIDGNGDPWVFGVSASSTTTGRATKLWQVDGTQLVDVVLPNGGSAWGGDSAGFQLARTLYPNGDFDADGVTNASEIASGTNPFESRSTPTAPLPIQSGIANNGSAVNFTFRLRPDANLVYISGISLGNGPTVLPDTRILPLSIPLELLSIGLLDANGDARTSLALPSNPLLVGLSFYIAYVTLDAAASLGVRTIGNDLAVTIR